MGLLRMWRNRNRVLGLNSRYLDYIRPYNLSKAFDIADDKALTKKVLEKADVPTPELIGVLKSYDDVHNFDFDTLPRSFVIKPVFGSEGRGIDIFYNRTGDEFIKGNGERVHIEGLKAKFRDIIEGRYSMFNQPDVVMIEERVRPHKAFRYYTYKGTPDIRVIMFNGVPIMGMLRLPTKESDGKANLKLGGIGGAIDIAAGKVMTAIKGKSGDIEYIPHTKQRISGLEIPYWDDILVAAAKAQKATGIGYGCFDFLIDRNKGPLLLEIGARAGLSIQLADKEGQRERLRRVKGMKIKSIEHGIRLGKSMFGGEIEENIESLTGKAVVGRIEKVKLFNRDGKGYKNTLAKIDTGAYRSSIDEELMRELGYNEAIDYWRSFNYDNIESYQAARKISKVRDKRIEAGEIEEHPDIAKRSIVRSSSGVTIRPVLKFRMELKDIEVATEVTPANRNDLKYKIIIGRRDLKSFLVDVSKNI